VPAGVLTAASAKLGHGHTPWTAVARGETRLPRAVALIVSAALVVVGVYWWRRGLAVASGGSDLARLALAVAIGVVVTAVHKRTRGERAAGVSLERAQTLLCLAGALTMILIDNSIARAFGVAGAASIIRFRTPVDDPTDTTVLFLLMGLGMASGLGAFDVAIVGTAGVCLALAAFGAVAAPETARRSITIELVSAGREFPHAHVRAVCARHGVILEPCEWTQDSATRVKYRASVDSQLSLETLGAELMDGGAAGLESVAWEVRKSAA
jgi:hypothetical protein